MTLRPAWCVLISFAAGVGATAEPAPPAGAVFEFFRTHAGLSNGDFERLQKGEPVTRTLPSDDSRDLIAFGAIRVAAEPQSLVRAFQDIETFKRSDIVLEIGKFSDPPRLEDLAPLTLDRSDFDDLRSCRPGDCGLRLPARDMERLRLAAAARTAAAHEETAALMRRVLFERLEEYRRGGDAAVDAYADKQPPVVYREILAALLHGAAALQASAPDLVRYVERYPEARPPGTSEFFYWSKEKFARKAVVSLTHVVIRERPAGSRAAVAIISKQLYASHYFDASVGASLMFDDEGAPGERFFLVYLNRSRNAGLAGFFGPFVRPIVRSRVRDGMIEHLRNVRARLERRSAGQPDRPSFADDR